MSFNFIVCLAFIVREKEDENGSRKSKGYGFITFEDKSSADDAIEGMHDTVIVQFNKSLIIII